MTLTIRECSPDSTEVKPLLDSLSEELLRITGNDGRASFTEGDIRVQRSVFLIAAIDGDPVGCGGLRPITENICEIKRMYAKYRGQGIGSEIVNALERYAQKFGYKEIWLETREINDNALKFYLRHGYQVRANYGKYVGRSEAICFGKVIAAK